MNWSIQKKGPLFVSLFNPLMLIVVAFVGWAILEERLHVGRYVNSSHDLYIAVLKLLAHMLLFYKYWKLLSKYCSVNSQSWNANYLLTLQYFQNISKNQKFHEVNYLVLHNISWSFFTKNAKLENSWTFSWEKKWP